MVWFIQYQFILPKKLALRAEEILELISES